MVSMAGSTGSGPIVIIGGGMAGGNAAVSLRQEGYTDRVTLISREPGIALAGLRYPRPTCGARTISGPGMSGRG
jgi:glycine/D-amino acid oxidase-like deaminating enzyme